MGDILTYVLAGVGATYFGKVILKNKEDAKKRVIGGTALGLAYAYKGPEAEARIRNSINTMTDDTKTRIYSAAGGGIIGALFGPKIREATKGIDEKVKSSIMK